MLVGAGERERRRRWEEAVGRGRGSLRNN
uniref:Uncharacterized protein n=1 Tax=Oryza punctata TaxID=4537 RepID=A0A0E0K141_ORYPU